jgi:hypothetical protein
MGQLHSTCTQPHLGALLHHALERVDFIRGVLDVAVQAAFESKGFDTSLSLFSFKG